MLETLKLLNKYYSPNTECQSPGSWIQENESERVKLTVQKHLFTRHHFRWWWVINPYQKNILPFTDEASKPQSQSVKRSGMRTLIWLEKPMFFLGCHEYRHKYSRIHPHQCRLEGIRARMPENIQFPCRKYSPLLWIFLWQTLLSNRDWHAVYPKKLHPIPLAAADLSAPQALASVLRPARGTKQSGPWRLSAPVCRFLKACLSLQPQDLVQCQPATTWFMGPLGRAGRARSFMRPR